MADIAFLAERLLRGFGVDLVIHALATELSRRGERVTVYASLVGGMPPGPYRVEKIPTRAVPVFPLYEREARLWAGFLDAAGHDLVFIESFPFFSLIPRLKTPAVAVDHGVCSTEGFPLHRRANFAYMRITQQRLYFPRAAGLVTVSHYVRSLLPGSLAGRARVIYNGVDHYPRVGPEEGTRFREELGIGEDAVLLLYVGRLNPKEQPYKGTADLVEAARRWREEGKPLRLVMAGRGSSEDAEWIRSAGAIPLLDLPAERMPALYAAADLYVTASRWEGFDLPLMEAAYQGVPAAALRVGAHPEVVQEGRTGVLAETPAALVGAIEELARDESRRKEMGSHAGQHAAGFTWTRAADAYLEVIREIGRLGAGGWGAVRPPARPGSDTGRWEVATSEVTAVVLNYGAPYEVLKRCLDSVFSQTVPVEVVLVDNASPTNLDAVERVEKEFPGLKVLRLSKNHGFAGGMNRGIQVASSEWVLLLNNDTVLDPHAVEEMLAVAKSADDVVGVAPKILLEHTPHVFDSVGTAINNVGAAFNVGIGQPDLGQYDRVERSFGACFAAALLKRKAFDPGVVGPLDERYFMYYEDVDWCLRAGVLGYRFLTAPRAVVYHAHSLSARERPYAFKYRLIERNLMRTVVRSFTWKRALRILLRRGLAHARNLVRGPYRSASLLVLLETLIWLPVYVRARRQVVGRRRAGEQELLDLSHGEATFFDPARYSPQPTLENLEAAYRRLALVRGDEKRRRIADELAALASSRLRFDREFLQERLAEVLRDEPDWVKGFARAVVEAGGRT